MKHRRIADKSASVVVVEPAAAIRRNICIELRKLGFKSITPLAGIRELISLLGLEKIHWVVMPLSTEQNVNALHFLKIICDNRPLSNIMTSLMLSRSEAEVIPSAYELGMMNVLSREAMSESGGPLLKKVLHDFEAYEWDGCKFSAANIRQHLKDQMRIKELETFETSLLNHTPHDPHQVVNLAEALFRAKKNEMGKTILWQASLLDDRMKDRIHELRSNFLSGETLDQVDEDHAFNFLGIDHVVVVDGDEAIQNLIRDIFRGIGVPHIKTFGDGEDAWIWIKDHPETQLIIQEWKIPTLTGPVLIQRIRQRGLVEVPIVVASGLIAESDIHLLNEMTVSGILNKPIKKKELLKTVIWALQQDRNPTEQRTSEAKIRKLLKGGKTKQAQKLIQAYLRDPGVPPIRKTIIKAEYAYHCGEYAIARDFALEHLKKAGESLLNLNLLGKSLMQLREFKIALECFHKLHKLSPLNVERLCAMAEINAELDDFDRAEEELSRAAKVDEGSTLVKETEVRISLSKGDTERAKKVMAKLESLDSLVAYMNNQGVALARSGSAKRSLEFYQKALKSLPEGRRSIAASLRYNLGLACIRSGNLEEALTHLDEAVKLKGTKVWKKSNSLKARVENALQTGKSLKLMSGPKPDPEEQLSPKAKNQELLERKASLVDELEGIRDEILSAVKANRGEIGCYLLYTNLEKPSDLVQALKANPPKFKLREVIAREEALGNERLFKRRRA